MIIFTDTDLIGSFIIRKFTKSNWSHVAIEHNGMVIESVTMATMNFSCVGRVCAAGLIFGECGACNKRSFLTDS